MIVFLHTYGVGRSSLLPLIRSTLQLDESFSDAQILSCFTLKVAGHFTNDDDVSVEILSNQLLTKIPELYQAQQNLSQKMLFSHPKHIIYELSNPKISLVGHGFGGAVAYHFALHYPAKIKQIAYIGFGESFKKLPLGLLYIKGKMFQKRKAEKQTAIIQKQPEIWQKTYLAMVAETAAKGVFSAITSGQKYSSQKLFQKITLDDQIKVLSIPTRLICGKEDEYVSLSSALTFAKIMEGTVITRKKQKQMLLHNQNQKAFSAKFYPEAGHHLPTTHTKQLSEELDLFLQNGHK